jgi:hypothetical protein
MSKYFDNKDMFLEPNVNQYGSHMVMTNVSKNSKHKYVNIDTKFRDEYNNNDTANYNITIPQRINEVKTVNVTNVEVPVTFFNISSHIGNNYFKLTNRSKNQSYMIVLADGQYTASSLTSEMDTKIGSHGTGDSDLIYYISNSKSVFYTNTDLFTVDFAVDSNGNFDKYNFKSKIGWLLGFRNLSYDINYFYTDNPAPGTGPDGQPLLTSEYMVNLMGTKYLYLAIDEFSSGNQNSFVSMLPTSLINKNIIARITMDYVSHPYGSLLPANRMNGLLTSDIRSFTGKIDMQKLNVQLLDENGSTIALNGYDFSFLMEIIHE